MAASVVATQTTTATSGGSGAATFTVNLPSGVTAGELLVVAATGFNMDNSSAAPSGWTRVSGYPNASSYYGGLFYKIADGSETTCALAVSTPGSAAMVAVAVRITGADPTTPIEASGTNNGNTTPQTAPSLTPSGAERLSLVMGSWQTSSSATPAATGYTTHGTASLSTGRVSLASKALTSTAATGSVSFNYGSGAQIFGHAHVLVRPSSAVAIVPGFISPATAVFTPTSVALNTQTFTVPLLAAATVLPEQRIQEGDRTIELPAWTPNTGTEIDYRSDTDYQSASDYRPSGLVVGTRVFEPTVALDAIGITVGHIAGTILYEPFVEGADRTIGLELIADAAVFTPGVTDRQSIDLGGSAALPTAATVFEPTIVAGDTTIAIEPLATTELFAPTAFDFVIELPAISSAATLWAAEPGYSIELPLLSTTRVFTQLIGQYLVIPEPDEAVWGASGGYSARIDILDPGGDVVASTGTASSGIVLVSGTVNEDITQPVTRECSVRLLLENTADGSRHPMLPAKPGDPLDPRTGGALAIYAGPIRPSGEPALVKLGVFKIIAANPTSTATGESLSLRGLSEETSISATPFYDVFNVSSGTPITQVIGDLVSQAIPNVRIHVESTGITAPQFSFADNDNRLAKVRELANAIGMVARFDRDGRFRVEHAAEYGDVAFVSPRWTFAEGAGAVMRDVGRELDDSELFNGVIVVGEPRDTNTDPVRAELWDSNPNSPVYYNPNNPGASRMGPRPKKVVSPLVYTVDQARALAVVLLTRILSYPDRISVSAAANPHIEAGDLARIVRTTMGVDGLYEVQSITHDLLGGASKAICVARV